jgi:hypothetical protein
MCGVVLCRYEDRLEALGLDDSLEAKENLAMFGNLLAAYIEIPYLGTCYRYVWWVQIEYDCVKYYVID